MAAQHGGVHGGVELFHVHISTPATEEYISSTVAEFTEMGEEPP